MCEGSNLYRNDRPGPRNKYNGTDVMYRMFRTASIRVISSLITFILKTFLPLAMFTNKPLNNIELYLSPLLLDIAVGKKPIPFFVCVKGNGLLQRATLLHDLRFVDARSLCLQGQTQTDLPNS